MKGYQHNIPSSTQVSRIVKVKANIAYYKWKTKITPKEKSKEATEIDPSLGTIWNKKKLMCNAHKIPPSRYSTSSEAPYCKVCQYDMSR